MKVIALCGHEMQIPPMAEQKIREGFIPRRCKDCYVAVRTFAELVGEEYN